MSNMDIDANDSNKKIQDGGWNPFASYSNAEKGVEELNKALKIELDGIPQGRGFKFTKRFELQRNEKKLELDEVINSKSPLKQEFYSIIRQWADKYGKSRPTLKADTRKQGFEAFVEDLERVFGSNNFKANVGPGTMTIYDDPDFYSALQPNVKSYVTDILKNLPSGSKQGATDLIVHIINTLSNVFNNLAKDPQIITNLGLCPEILKALANSAGKNPINYMKVLTSINTKLASFKQACGTTQAIKLSLEWLKKDKATGKTIGEKHKFNETDFDLVLEKLSTFNDLYVIFPSLTTDKRMKKIVYGGVNETGKLVNWMKYVRQYIAQRKKTTTEGPKSQYWKKFMTAYENLLLHTFPELFGTSAADDLTGKEIGFFESIINLFSPPTPTNKYFKIVKNDLYKETILWLSTLRPHDYVRFLEKTLKAFPNIINHSSFTRATDLDEKILKLFSVSRDYKTGEVSKFGNDFTSMKRNFDSLGRILANHRFAGNVIDNLYIDADFNRKFYNNLSEVVHTFPNDAKIFGLEVKEGEGTWDQISDEFYDTLYQSATKIKGYNGKSRDELVTWLDETLSINGVVSFLPKKVLIENKITGTEPITDDQVVARMKAMETGSKKTFSTDDAKGGFRSILLTLMKKYRGYDRSSYKFLIINGQEIYPDQALAWYEFDGFINPTDDIMKQIREKSFQGGPSSVNKSPLEGPVRQDIRDVSKDVEDPQINQILQENLPEVSSLSNEITNLLKIINEQGQHLQQTDELIDQLIVDENTILQDVSAKVDDVNSIIQVNDLDIKTRMKKNERKKTVTPARPLPPPNQQTPPTIQLTIQQPAQTAGRRNRDVVIGKYKSTDGIKTLYRHDKTKSFYYITKNNNRKKIDINSSRVIY